MKVATILISFVIFTNIILATETIIHDEPAFLKGFDLSIINLIHRKSIQKFTSQKNIIFS